MLLVASFFCRCGRNINYQYCRDHRINPYLKQSPQVPETLENSEYWSPECKHAFPLQVKAAHTSWLSCNTSNLLEIQRRATSSSGQAVLLAWRSTEIATPAQGWLCFSSRSLLQPCMEGQKAQTECFPAHKCKESPITSNKTQARSSRVLT